MKLLGEGQKITYYPNQQNCRYTVDANGVTQNKFYTQNPAASIWAKTGIKSPLHTIISQFLNSNRVYPHLSNSDGKIGMQD